MRAITFPSMNDNFLRLYDEVCRYRVGSQNRLLSRSCSDTLPEMRLSRIQVVIKEEDLSGAALGYV